MQRSNKLPVCSQADSGSEAEALKSGYRYTLNSDWREYFNRRGLSGYDYAQPVRYAHGCFMGDCWIVNAQGKKLPGYTNHPVPLHGSSLSDPQKSKARRS